MLYIDPGTGSMLFAILIGVIGAAQYLLRVGIVKLKFILSGGKVNETNEKKIPYVIFADDKRYWNVFEPICRELDSRGVDVVYMTASPDDPALDNKYPHIKGEFIGEGNKAFAKLNFLNASIVLSTTPGLDVYQWKRSKDVDCYIHIFHAPNDVTLYKMFGIDYYDALMFSGEYQVNDVRKLEALRGLPEKESIIVGLPYMDVMAERLASSPEVVEHKRTVLLAPSWGESAILNKYGSKIIDKLIGTGYKIIIRPHPQSFKSEKEMIDKLMEKYPNSENLEWNRDNDNFEVLKNSDIMISDFSGVIFDFALVYDKPVICADTKFDTAPYDAWWLKDNELWTYKTVAKLGKPLTEENMNNIKEIIDTCLESGEYAEARDAARKETWQNKGNGAVLAADFIMKKYADVSDKGKENK